MKVRYKHTIDRVGSQEAEAEYFPHSPGPVPTPAELLLSLMDTIHNYEKDPAAPKARQPVGKIKEGSLGQSVHNNKKYTVDCFVGPKEEGYSFPENSYDCDSVADVEDVIINVQREDSGIRLVQVWINNPAGGPESITPEKAGGPKFKVGDTVMPIEGHENIGPLRVVRANDETKVLFAADSKGERYRFLFSEVAHYSC